MQKGMYIARMSSKLRQIFRKIRGSTKPCLLITRLVCWHQRAIFGLVQVGPLTAFVLGEASSFPSCVLRVHIPSKPFIPSCFLYEQADWCIEKQSTFFVSKPFLSTCR